MNNILCDNILCDNICVTIFFIEYENMRKKVCDDNSVICFIFEYEKHLGILASFLMSGNTHIISHVWENSHLFSCLGILASFLMSGNTPIFSHVRE